MKISVAIPAHNEEKYIARCLSSINNQLCPLELVEVYSLVDTDVASVVDAEQICS